ncbi:unnamed protein product [Dovyalis caffra]|uniref:Maturase K n=1 Tax=Dovyalis caffra TaxID=77055 RepID=A0AAV1SPG7_9ROSI|nr:unnamed protein product [Dovyalis caffra]
MEEEEEEEENLEEALFYSNRNESDIAIKCEKAGRSEREEKFLLLKLYHLHYKRRFGILKEAAGARFLQIFH